MHRRGFKSHRRQSARSPVYFFLPIGTLLWCLLCSLPMQASSSQTDQLVIISPHRKSIQREFIPRFKSFYLQRFKRAVMVDWLDQGGASDDLRYVLSRFESRPTGIGVDILWGGGEQPHYELDKRNLLQSYRLPGHLRAQIPQYVGSVPLFNDRETWHASAMSAFGIFYNKRAAKLLSIPEPMDWTDLGKPAYYKNIAMADPRRSSSSITMIVIILKAYGWEKGWRLLTKIAANTKAFMHSSSDPVKSVLTGDTTTGFSIGYYAREKILEVGAQNLGFVLPAGKTIFNADPISILKGASNKLVAQRFIEFVLSPSAQKLLILPKGHAHGPTFAGIGRMAVNKEAYSSTADVVPAEDNPFALGKTSFRFDMNEATHIQGVVMDLFTSYMVDNHANLKRAWKNVVRDGMSPKMLEKLTQPPLLESELQKLAARWNNQTLRNEKINVWQHAAKKRYTDIANSTR